VLAIGLPQRSFGPNKTAVGSDSGAVGLALLHHAMTKILFRLAVLCSIVGFISGISRADAQSLPDPVGKVNDFAGALEASQRATLESQLEDLERETSAEVALVTVPTLDGRSVEEYANALFNTWGIGKQGRDNGVLVLVAVQDRTMRIEVGYGLEGVLSDGLAGALMRETFLPRFRDDDYRAGILDGMTRVIDIVRRAEPLTPAQLAALEQSAAAARKSWAWLWFMAIFAGLGSFMAGTAAGAKVAVQLVFGIIFAGAALVLSTFIMPIAAVVVLGLFAAAITVLGFRMAQKPDWRLTLRGTGKSSGGQGWLASGGRGVSSSSGSSSGGSRSFGGGRSGGGGASGRW